ncbi:MAG: thioredoxin family protein [Oscillospiraceae bacterium]|nr:thioredoxin family protein [Oscillospiraceae bacterium]
MALFNFGKKKEEKKVPTCCCNAEPVAEETACCCGTAPKAEQAVSCCCGAPVEGICCIKVLGAGCKSCHDQYEFAQAAAKSMGLDVEVEYITDMEKVMEYGVMSMPAIVVNEQVVSMGKVLKVADVEGLLHKLGY